MLLNAWKSCDGFLSGGSSRRNPRPFPGLVAPVKSITNVMPMPVENMTLGLDTSGRSLNAELGSNTNIDRDLVYISKHMLLVEHPLPLKLREDLLRYLPEAAHFENIVNSVDLVDSVKSVKSVKSIKLVPFVSDIFDATTKDLLAQVTQALVNTLEDKLGPLDVTEEWVRFQPRKKPG
eukprot:gene15354-21441_t